MGKKVVSMEAKLLAVLSARVPLNVTALCAELGISRQTFYKYRRRYELDGPEGLLERSRRPHRSPNQVPIELEDAIVRLRKELPLDNGAQTIAFHLARSGAVERVPSVATIHRVLARRGRITAQPEKRPRSSWRRFEWPRPNDAFQVDATQWVLADGGSVWIMDVLDDHSRVLAAARVCSGPTSAAAWDAFAHACADWGIPARVMSDNGVCFTGRFLHHGDHRNEVDFERQLRAMGVAHLLSSPSHPQTCGKLERSHQSTKNWLRTQRPAATPSDLQDDLDRWRHHYNHERPHAGIGGATPYERWSSQPPAGPGPAIAGPRRTSLHRVDNAGSITWNGYRIAVGSPLAGQRLLVVATDLDLTIHGQTGHIRSLTIDTTRRYQPSGKPRGRPPKQRP
jgi:transposase InsO family protein